MSMAQIINGDARRLPLADKSVHCCVTSPPYFGLRDYGTAEWVGGDPGCDHLAGPMVSGKSTLRAGRADRPDGRIYDDEKLDVSGIPYRDTCGKCGARRVDRQIGLEATPDLFVAAMVAVFREIKRVLRDDGTCWLNLGDSYATGTDAPRNPTAITGDQVPASWSNRCQKERLGPIEGIPAKNLLMMPHRVALALQADGWVLRSEIIWAKPNPMPESVIDRPTKSHEQVFLFSKAHWVGPDKGRFAHISAEDARWLALLIDAEGNICIKRTKKGDLGDAFGAQIAIGSTSRPLMEKVAGIVGKGTVHERPGKNALMYYWQVTHGDARDLLRIVYPYLIIKPRQARLAIHTEFLVRHRGKRGANKWRTPEETALLVKCWETNKILNHFGDPDLSWVPEIKYGNWVPNRYYFDAEAVREKAEYGRCEWTNNGTAWSRAMHGSNTDKRTNEPASIKAGSGGSRNLRSVWSIPTEPMMRLRSDLTPEQRAHVISELSRRGLL